ncbi:hypothetical protein, unlikely [Trypanosoma brucei gambiense DAL972]|uniref:Uncharacterized protein n=1 Tax=Trypanosoma brucei gambiense (strain MHOM/CI/86/DAL972) TaxID=679716 RepID=D0A3G2_TRYB9|nr:hypothetical protein, unlikely [Trypanosoma brucei gambiense DAL972]CBH15806.1 hypothetical protein, unlikely [Trypanosoma brucei gambiense DAL972]|eukprot:XP_011778070.1 hypothetical protein, unlikely [Trypanosoma brucei gambiense DAL972]
MHLIIIYFFCFYSYSAPSTSLFLVLLRFASFPHGQLLRPRIGCWATLVAVRKKEIRHPRLLTYLKLLLDNIRGCLSSFLELVLPALSHYFQKILFLEKDRL